MVELMENIVIDEEKNEHEKAMEEVQMKTYKSTVGIANGSMLGNEFSICLGMRDAICGVIAKESSCFNEKMEYRDYRYGYRYMFQLKMRFLQKYKEILSPNEIIKMMMQGHQLYEFYDDL